MDVVDAATRSKMMAGIRSKDTGPEMTVRKFLHAQGFRYRLHARKLPGSPDIVLPKYGVAIFVHGCFWHRHGGCRYATSPVSNADRWVAKFRTNIERDERNEFALREAGWRVIIVWECELRREPLNRMQRLVEQIVRIEAASSAPTNGGGFKPRTPVNSARSARKGSLAC